MTPLIDIDYGGTLTDFCLVAADLPADADCVFAPTRPGLTRSRDDTGPILGATGPGQALQDS